MAPGARMRKRHWGVLLSFLVLVLVPVLGMGWYLLNRSEDQYASYAGFSVRKEDSTATADLMGGLSSFMGTMGDGEADMLYEFIRSQSLVAAIDARLNLTSHYSAPYENDPLFALKPGGTIEDLVDYWGRVVRLSYDRNTGLINLRVVGFSPDMARSVAQEIIAESQRLVNELNATARTDTLRFAERDLEEALARLKEAREALIRFRTRTQIVDPESDLRGRMGVIASLQQQLAESLVDHDVIVQDAPSQDPRVTQAQRLIDVIRARIAEERQAFTEEDIQTGGEDYPTLLAEYEGLVVEREFAEETYRVALTAFDLARANAARQSRYLATYIRPTLPQKSEFPERGMIFALVALFLFLSWAILTLIVYAVRDRK